MLRRKWLIWSYVAVTILSALGTIATAFRPIDPGPIRPICGILMIALGFAIAVRGLSSAWRVLVTLGFCALAEIVGLLTGFPFGRYEYTDRWFPTVSLGSGHLFPVLLPFAWLMIVGGCVKFVRGRNIRYPVLATAMLVMLVDFVMERAMTKVFGYWKWLSLTGFGDAPWTNAVGWFGVGFCASLLLGARKADRKADAEAVLVVGMFLGFVALSGVLQAPDLSWLLPTYVALQFGIIAKQFYRSKKKLTNEKEVGA